MLDVIVIGGGAAGLSAAIAAAENGESVLLLEKSDRIGRKILASGNGRCNLINSEMKAYYGDSRFAAAVLEHIPVSELISFFHRYGLLLTSESNGRMYPVTFQSASVVSLLKYAMMINHVKTVTGSPVQSLYIDKDHFRVVCAEGLSYSSRRVIVTCGGAAQPKLGGSSDGYQILQSAGHTLTDVFPALVPVITDQKSISGLSGLRVRCQAALYDHQNLLHQENGELLFTDYGISGICIMQCARFVHHHRSHFEIDFLYDTFANSEDVFLELKRRRQIYEALTPVVLLEGILPAKLSYAVMKQAGISLHGETSACLNDSDLRRIVHASRHYRIDVLDTKGFQYAQVTAGGISCEQFNPDTMESLIRPGLYAAGEVLNIDGDCGGYNLMFAFASGMLAGRSGKRGERTNEKG